jgi:hypothetical protein
VSEKEDEPALCRSTRYGRGCGHPTTEHNGTGECCCCNWKHNDLAHVWECIECHRRRFSTPGMTAGEFERFLPEHLKRPYWEQKITEWAAQQGLDPDAVAEHPLVAMVARSRRAAAQYTSDED